MRSSARTTCRSARPTSPTIVSKVIDAAARRGVQHAQRRHQRRLLQGADRQGQHRRDQIPTISVSVAEEEVSRHRHRQHRGPPRGVELLPDDRQRPRTRSSSRPSRPSTARTGSPPTRSRPATTRVYIWAAAAEKAGSFEVDDGQGGRQGPRARHARGPAHGQRLEPARLQDGPHRRHQRRGPDRRGVGSDGRSSPTPASTTTTGPPASPTGECDASSRPDRAAGAASRPPPGPSPRPARPSATGRTDRRRGGTRVENFLEQLFIGLSLALDPAARRARPDVHVRPDGRHQHGPRRVHHGRAPTPPTCCRRQHRAVRRGHAALAFVVALPVAFVVAGAHGRGARAAADPPHVRPAARHPARHLRRQPDPAAGGQGPLRGPERRTCVAPTWLTGNWTVFGVTMPHTRLFIMALVGGGRSPACRCS